MRSLGLVWTAILVLVLAALVASPRLREVSRFLRGCFSDR